MIYDKVAEVLLKLGHEKIRLYGYYGEKPICEDGGCNERENLILIKYKNTEFVYFSCEKHLKSLTERSYTLYE